MVHLQTRNIRLIIYIEDMHRQNNWQQITLVLLILDLLEVLCFLPQVYTSSNSRYRIPRICGEFRRDETSPTSRENVCDYKEATTILNPRNRVSIHQLARMIGLLSTTIPAVLPAPLHYCNLDLDRTALLYLEIARTQIKPV